LKSVDEHIVDEAVDSVRTWGHNFVMPDEIEKPAVEMALAFDDKWCPAPSWSDDSARFRAKLDWTFFIDRKTVVITDWKSDRHLPSSAVVENDMQLKIYAYCLWLIYPNTKQFVIRRHYMRFGKMYEWVLTIKEILPIGRELAGKMEEIDNCKEFEPRVGSYCDYCGYIDRCPKMQKALVASNPYVIITQENAERAAELLMAIDRVKKEITARMKDYVVLHGEGVVVGDKCIDFHPTESINFPDGEKLAAALVGVGLSKQEVWNVFSATKASVEKVLKKAKKLEHLQTIKEKSGAEEKSGSRFEFKKVA
jgi:hypothetical protein